MWNFKFSAVKAAVVASGLGTFGAVGVFNASACPVDFEVYALQDKTSKTYQTKGVLVHESGVCIVGLPNDRTIQSIELKGKKGSKVKLISYDTYGRYAFIKLSKEHVNGKKPTAMKVAFPEKAVKLQGEGGEFLVAGKVGVHNGKVIPFSFYRLHRGGYAKNESQFPFLIDSSGALVGMLHSEVLGAKGAFYSIPSKVLQKHLDDVVSFGMPTRAWVGVALDSNVGLPVVTGVRPTSSAALAGFQKGDIITAISGEKVPDYDSAVKAFYLLKAEQETTFKVVRGDKELNLSFSPKKFPGGGF